MTPPFDQDAHEITTPSGQRFVSLTGVAVYANNPGYTVTAVRGHHDEHGRGFRVTSRGQSHTVAPAVEDVPRKQSITKIQACL